MFEHFYIKKFFYLKFEAYSSTLRFARFVCSGDDLYFLEYNFLS